MFWQIFKFGVKKYLVTVLVTALLILLFFLGIANNIDNYIPTWAGVWDPFFAVLGPILVLSVTIYFLRREWSQSLSTTSIIHFVDRLGEQENYIYSVYGGVLLEDTDLRAFTQQVGRQISGKDDLKFNPSFLLEKEELLAIKNESNNKEWVRIKEVKVYLKEEKTEGEEKIIYNNGNYTVWNLNKRTDEYMHLPPSTDDFISLFSNALALKDMLSQDDESFNKFLELKKNSSAQIHTMYIISSSMLPSFGSYQYIRLSKEQLIEEYNKHTGLKVSAIGHDGTATHFNQLLNAELKKDRININMKVGDKCLICKPAQRQKEGVVATEDELNEMKFIYGLIVRIA